MIDQGCARRFAHQSHVDLHVAQQDIVLLYALDLLRDRAILPRLAFKGGTYLRKMVLGQQGRFSEDLDFTAIQIPRDPEALFVRALREPHFGVQFALEKPYTTPRGWASPVSYKHRWDEGRFKLEVSFREPPSLPLDARTPLEQLYFDDLPFPPPKIPCLQLSEALAEKVRAAQQRATDRDIFDLIQYSKTKFRPEPVRLLAAVKLWNDREPFQPERILAALSDGRWDWGELLNLVGRADRTDWTAESRRAAGRFAFLSDLTEFERALIADHRRHSLVERIAPALSRMLR